MDERANIVGKVAKLLALASGSGGTEAERFLALERAEGLMEKHRIEQHELAKVQGRESLQGVEKQGLVDTGGRSLRFAFANFWRIHLYGAIGKGVGVDAIYITDPRGRVVWLVGRPDSIAYTKLVADWIEPQLRRECAKALKERKAERPGLWERRGWTGEVNPGAAASASIEFNRSFYESAVAAISDRLEDRRRSRGTVQSKELVRSDDAAKAEFYGDRAPTQVSESVYSGMGATAGADVGERVDIDPANKVGPAARGELAS